MLHFLISPSEILCLLSFKAWEAKAKSTQLRNRFFSEWASLVLFWTGFRLSFSGLSCSSVWVANVNTQDFTRDDLGYEVNRSAKLYELWTTHHELKCTLYHYFSQCLHPSLQKPLLCCPSPIVPSGSNWLGASKEKLLQFLKASLMKHYILSSRWAICIPALDISKFLTSSFVSFLCCPSTFAIYHFPGVNCSHSSTSYLCRPNVSYVSPFAINITILKILKSTYNKYYHT